MRPEFDKQMPHNNHIEGAGVPNFMKELIFVKSESKINRMHHRFITKKRNWLIRQIDPAKRYLHMLRKQVKMQKTEEIKK